MATSFDPAKSCTIVIGSSTYNDSALPALESVFDNCQRMSHLFRRFLKIPPEQRTILLDQTKKDVYHNVKRYVSNPNMELLILYFSGHGIVSSDRKSYYLALKETEMDHLKLTSIDVRDLSEELGNRISVILIIDSCFSEKVFDVFDSRRCFIMASSARDTASQYPLGEDGSVFSDALFEVIEKGIASEKPTLTAQDIFEAVRQKLALSGGPTPHRSAVNDVDQMAIFPNNNRIEGSIEAKMVERIFDSIKAVCNDEIKREIPEVIIRNNNHPEGKEIQLFILKKFPLFIASPLRRLLFNANIVNRESIKDYRRIVHFLGLCLLADLVRVNGLKNTFEKPIEYLRSASHLGFRKLFKELSAHRSEIFIEELKHKMPVLEGLMDQVERAGEQELATDVQPLLIEMISELAFFVNYDFLSVKLISVRKRFLEPDEFIHSVSELKGDEVKNYGSTLRFKKCYLNSSAVLLFKASSPVNIHHDDKYVNLWPLIIDVNTLKSRDNAPQIYLFQERDNDMHYYFRHAISEDPIAIKYTDIDQELETEELKRHFHAFEEYFE